MTGRKALLDMVGQLGGWPILEGNNWEDKTFTWQGFDGKIYKSKIINKPI